MARSEIKNETVSLMVGSPKSIILVPLHNFMVKNTVYSPRLVQASYRYDFDEIEDYFYRSLSMIYLPFHYFCGIVEDDYICTVGCPLSNKSCFINELCAVNAIQELHQNAIVIALQDDYRLEPVDRRMMAYLSNYVISPLMRIFSLSQERVFFFDELLLPDWQYRITQINNLKRRFDISTSKYFDKNMLLFNLRNFYKK